MKKITLLLMLVAVSLGYSQQVVQDFENGGLGGVFGGLASQAIVADPAPMGTNGMVAELITSDAGEVWQGTNISVNMNVVLTTDKTMTVDVYSTTALSLAVKVTDSNDGGPDSTTSIDHDGTGWETITATFDTAQDNSGVANGTYTNFVVYPNWDPNTNTYINPPVVRTIYIDNITGITPSDPCANGVQDGDETGVDCGGSCPNACPPADPTTNAPAPAIDETEVLSVFADDYTSAAGVTNFNFNAFAGAGTYSTVDIQSDGKLTGKLENLTFYGAQWDAVDLTEDDGTGRRAPKYNFVHIDYYATTSTEFNFYLIDETAGIPGGNSEEPRYRFGGATPDQAIVAGSWQSVAIPLSHFTDYPTPSYSYDLTDIFQWKFDGNGTVFFDNVYFSKVDTTLGTEDFDSANFAAYPNPTTDKWNIKTNGQDITSVQVFDMLGKSVMSLTPNRNAIEVDATDLPAGLYFARVSSENGTKSIKLIKQ